MPLVSSQGRSGAVGSAQAGNGQIPSGASNMAGKSPLTDDRHSGNLAQLLKMTIYS